MKWKPGWKPAAPERIVPDRPHQGRSTADHSNLERPGHSGSGLPWVYPGFLALTPEQSALETARVVLLPVPYDSTTSYRSGARDGPAGIIAASAQMEDYDPELDLDVAGLGIHTMPMLEPHMGGPGPMTQRVRDAVAACITPGRTVGVLGGEHSLTAGSVQAHHAAYPSLSVLYLDAHADLRDEYQGTPWGHASGARRVFDLCPVVLAGVRSLCLEERDFIRDNSIPFWRCPEDGGPLPADDILAALGDDVYVSVDLDVFDPALMPAVGTPEPGGLSWGQVVSLLRRVGESRRIVGFDVCELAPAEGPAACSYTAARLVGKLAAYSTLV